MRNCLQPSRLVTQPVSTRAAAHRHAMWHFGTGTNAFIPTVGTGFKPYDQRPKETLL